MGIAVLNELQDRLHTVMIAGLSVLEEDFRLRRAVEQFEAVAATVPVLGKIHQQVKSLLDSNQDNKEVVLLRVVALVDAVVCTQGTSAVEGAVTPLVTAGVSSTTLLCRYSELEPLISALTQKGSGRYEVVATAWRERQAVLGDFRLKSALVHALGDSYSEMAELVETILRSEGIGLVPLLQYQFDPHGGTEMVRRLRLMETLAGGAENAFYLGLLQDSSPAVREEAICALQFEPGNADKLIELATTEKGAAKKAALRTLGRMETPETDAFWSKELKKSSGGAEQYLTLNGSVVISDLIADKLLRMLQALPQEKDATIPKTEAEQLRRMLFALPNKCTQSVLDLLEYLVQQSKQISSLREEGSKDSLMRDYAHTTEGLFSETGLIQIVNQRLIAGMAETMRPELLAAIKGLYQRTGTAYLTAGLAAHLLSDPDHAYDAFAPLFQDTASVEQILRCFTRIRVENGQYVLRYWVGDAGSYCRPLGERLDPRWLEAFTRRKKNIFRSYFDRDPFGSKDRHMLIQLINEKDGASLPFLRDYFLQEAKLGRNTSNLYALLACGWKDFTGLIPTYLTRCTRFKYYEMVELYRRLPMPHAAAVKELYSIADAIECGTVHSEYKTEFTRVRNYANEFEHRYYSN